MECRQLHRDELAEKYLNGQLDPSLRDEFEVHILECAPCLRSVEAVQTLGQELAERAPQIRAYSQIERSPFRRWKWVTVAAFGLVVCGLGLVEFRRMKAPQSAKLPVQPPVSATSAAGSNGPPALTNSSQPSSVDNLPVNARAYFNFKLNDSQATRDNAPSIGSIPRSKLSLKGQRARSNLVNVDGADSADNSTTGMRDSIEQPATLSSASRPAPENVQAPEIATDETAKELFRLGTVQPPPYTFSAFGSSGKNAAGEVNPNALSDKSGASRSSDPTRVFFRNAMNAYVEKRYMDALELLEGAVKAEPGAPDVNFYLGICRLLEARPEDSVAPLNVVLEHKESPLTQAAHFYLAKAYVQSGRLAEAEAQLLAATEMPGNLSTEAGLELARLQALRTKAGQPSGTEAPRP
jgi:hypothetical protein